MVTQHPAIVAASSAPGGISLITGTVEGDAPAAGAPSRTANVTGENRSLSRYWMSSHGCDSSSADADRSYSPVAALLERPYAAAAAAAAFLESAPQAAGMGLDAPVAAAEAGTCGVAESGWRGSDMAAVAADIARLLGAEGSYYPAPQRAGYAPRDCNGPALSAVEQLGSNSGMTPGAGEGLLLPLSQQRQQLPEQQKQKHRARANSPCASNFRDDTGQQKQGVAAQEASAGIASNSSGHIFTDLAVCGSSHQLTRQHCTDNSINMAVVSATAAASGAVLPSMPGLFGVFPAIGSPKGGRRCAGEYSSGPKAGGNASCIAEAAATGASEIGTVLQHSLAMEKPESGPGIILSPWKAYVVMHSQI